MSYPKGKPKSEEIKRKDRISCLKFWTDEKKQERAEKYSGSRNPFFNKKHSEKTKEKLIQINTGKKYPLETRLKISQSLVGNQRAKGNKYSLTIEQRRHLSESKKGDKSPFWKGGISSINALIRNSFEYKNCRRTVFERDDYTCQECGQKGGTLNAHHIKQFAYSPELRFELSNGLSLCLDCHKQTDTFANKNINLVYT